MESVLVAVAVVSLFGTLAIACSSTDPAQTSDAVTKPESTEGGRRVSVLKRQEGVPVNLG